MPIITLPDGSQRHFDHPVTVDEVAGSIGAGLRKAALAGRVNGKLVDTSHVVASDADLAIVRLGTEVEAAKRMGASVAEVRLLLTQERDHRAFDKKLTNDLGAPGSNCGSNRELASETPTGCGKWSKSIPPRRSTQKEVFEPIVILRY